MISETVKFARRLGIVFGAIIALGTVAYAVFVGPIAETATEAKNIATKGGERLERHIETEMAIIYRMSGQLDAMAVRFGIGEPKPPIMVPLPIFVGGGQ